MAQPNLTLTQPEKYSSSTTPIQEQSKTPFPLWRPPSPATRSRDEWRSNESFKHFCSPVVVVVVIIHRSTARDRLSLSGSVAEWHHWQTRPPTAYPWQHGNSQRAAKHTISSPTSPAVGAGTATTSIGGQNRAVFRW